MLANEIRQKFLEFFKNKGHSVIPSAPLVPENDPTVLFTTAGMQPLVPYLLGQKHALGNRLVNSQKCLRTDDIDEVGDNTHLTFFEMLGNWSLGDYFKRETIEWSFEFLTKELNIPLEKIAISVFEGEAENNILKDDESAKIWQGLGVSRERIAYLPRSENWWGPAGATGPCGPDTEMFYWTGEGSAPVKFDPEDDRWVEIWNDVFMQYNKKIKNQKSKIKDTNQNSKISGQEEYEFVALAQKNVDTGMGLERISAVLQGKDNVFETELFLPIIQKIDSARNSVPCRIIADHIKAATFILAEQVAPSNLERGYVLRRLIRRAIRYGKVLGIERQFTAELAREVIKIYQQPYPELSKNQDFILEELKKEEENFAKTLNRGLKEFEKLSAGGISAKEAFLLYQSYGFPIEITKDLAKEKGIKVDEKGFEQELKKHQDLSRTAAKGKFKSGLADQSEKTIKYHTATHLLLAALRYVLGKEIKQMGSNITPARLRFDFSFDRKLTDDEVGKIEEMVNQKIKQGLEIKTEEMSIDQALKQVDFAFEKERYPAKVKVYSIIDKQAGKPFSKEICSGPHCETTFDLGRFKIIKQKASSHGVRRIRAVLE